jgi:ATP-dependent Clp endopeptidase proteolytic subunit ClpP
MATYTELTDLLAYGVDIKNRRIYFGVNLDQADENAFSDFTPGSVEVAVRAMHRMALEGPGKPIEIHMNSYGGDPYAMLRLHDEILASPCQIKFYGGGAIMSAATWIMACCDERYLHPNATVMVHDGWGGTEGKHTDTLIWAKEETRLQDLLYDIYTTNSHMPKEFWADVCQRDLYLTASEAVSLGLADKVLEPKKRGNLRKVRQAAMKKAPDQATMKELLRGVYSRINKVKVPRIELNAVIKEAVDPNLVVAEIEKVPQPTATEPSKETS